MNAYHHISARLFNTPLMIHPGKLQAIVTGLQSRLHITVAPAAFTTAQTTREKGGYRLTDSGIGILDIFGGLAHHGGIQADSSYIEGYDFIARSLDRAMRDNKVRALLLNFDSPGGEVSGAFDLATMIADARAKKPLAAVAGDMAASAAYLLASAAGKVYVSQTGMVGSIGVVTCHFSAEKAIENQGYAVTLLYAGAHKVDGNPYQNLQPETADRLQADVQFYYEKFVNAVAQYRPALTPDALRATEAAVFIAEQAVTAGLADGVMSPDAALKLLETRYGKRRDTPKASLLIQGPSMSDVEPENTAPVPDGQPTTPAAITPVAIVKACNAAGEPRLAEHLLAQPALTEAALQEAVATAKSIRAICKVATAPAAFADALIAAGTSVADAKLAVWDILVKQAAKQPIDATTPQRTGNRMNRAAFDALTPVEKRDFMRNSGTITE